jgi:hypothetical protein
VAWPLGSHNGSVAMGEFCELVDDVTSTRDCANLTRSVKYIDAATALHAAMRRRRHDALPRPEPAPRTDYPYPIAGFWHVATAGRFWDVISADQLNALTDSGLDEAADFIDVVHVGGDSLAFERPKFRPLNGGADLGVYEFPTLQRLQDFCHQNPRARVFYIHNKGSTQGSLEMDTFLPVLDWRQYMEHFVITRFRDCLAALDRGFDTCGVNLKPYPQRHYSGNMWWAKCAFIRTLPPVASLDKDDRFSAEFWMAKSDDWRPKMCFNVTYNMYKKRVLPDQYEGSAGCSGGDPDSWFDPANSLR